MWQNPHWQGQFFSQDCQTSEALQQYSSVFNSVEGNTSFYALPRAELVNRWMQQTPSQFTFAFKFPRQVTHELQLKHADKPTSDFLKRLQPLGDRLGPMMIQLPTSFSPRDLPVLESFIRTLSIEFSYSVEVRHQAFFEPSAHRQLAKLLTKYRIDTVIFDSRGLFSSYAVDNHTLEAKRKKPNLPVTYHATANNPIIRFIGHEDLQANNVFFKECADAIVYWLRKGKTPYLFPHLADNSRAYLFAEYLHQQLQAKLPNLEDLASWPADRESASGQIGLF